MLNLSVLILVFLLLVSQKVLLLNEETLILFCFITFCWVIFNRMNESVNANFLDRSGKIEQAFISSLDQVEKVLISNMNLHRKFRSLGLDFELLKNHFIKLNRIISNKLVNCLVQNSQAAYLNKMIFAQRLEQQTTKLLTLLLSKKIHEIVLLRQFCTQRLGFSNFLCFYKISLREYFEII